MNSLFTEFWQIFGPGFLGLDDSAGEGGRGAGFLGLDDTAGGGSGGREYSVQFYWHIEIQCRVLLGHRNTVLPYYLLFTIQFLKNPEIYFRYYIILFTGHWKATGQNFGNRFNCNQFTSKLVNMEISAC